MPGWCDGDCDGVRPDQLLVRVGDRWLCGTCWQKAGRPWPNTNSQRTPQPKRQEAR